MSGKDKHLEKVADLPTVKKTALVLEELPGNIKKKCYLPTVKLSPSEVKLLKELSKSFK